MRKNRSLGFIILILDILTVIFFLVIALINLLKGKEKMVAIISFLKQIFFH